MIYESNSKLLEKENRIFFLFREDTTPEVMRFPVGYQDFFDGQNF